ncbi:MAG: helix-turn-helix transcriptional regulator [Solirubrobacterales bacterium]|nr:helix-turn-helix transcriptional regulator [Solirubrobacterales bacterium]
MTGIQEPWWAQNRPDSSVADEVELGDVDGAVSDRVRRKQVSEKTRKAAARIIQKLDDRRERKGLSKAALARKVKKQPASCRRLFSGESNPELFTLIEIANALDADIVLKPRTPRRATSAPPWRDDPEAWEDDWLEHQSRHSRDSE